MILVLSYAYACISFIPYAKVKLPLDTIMIREPL
jgi:hypothetical protein